VIVPEPSVAGGRRQQGPPSSTWPWSGPTTTGCPSTARTPPTASAAPPASPIRGVKDAVAEVERVASMPGIVAFNLSCYPPRRDDDQHRRRSGVGGDPGDRHADHDPHRPQRRHAVPARGPASFPAPSTSNDAPGRNARADLQRIFERFPGLKFAMTEVELRLGPVLSPTRPTTTTCATRRRPCGVRSSLSCPVTTSASTSRSASSRTCTASRTAIASASRTCCGRTTTPAHRLRLAVLVEDDQLPVRRMPLDERHAILAGNSLKLYKFGSK